VTKIIHLPQIARSFNIISTLYLGISDPTRLLGTWLHSSQTLSKS